MAGGFALLGVGITNWRAGRREEADFRRETSLELAGMERLIWGGSYPELRGHIERQRARMSEARVPRDLVDAFESITVACWRSNQIQKRDQSARPTTPSRAQVPGDTGGSPHFARPSRRCAAQVVPVRVAVMSRDASLRDDARGSTVLPGDGQSVAPANAKAFRDSPEWRRRRAGLHIIAILGVLCAGAAILLWPAFVASPYDEMGDRTEQPSTLLLVASIAASVVFLVLALTWYGLRVSTVAAYQDRLDRERSERLRAERDAAAPDAEAELTRLLSANRALLDEYQRPVRAQARTSYTFGQIAICVGLVVLLAGVAVTLAADDPSARLGVAGLTAVGAALSGYIARTFLRVYETAQHQLNYYFREPLVTSYLLAAERLAEKLEGERRDDAYAEMVGEIVRALGGDLRGGPPGASSSG